MSDDDKKLLESVLLALDKIDKKSAAIRFEKSGAHIDENRIVGTLDGYKMLGMRIVQAALKNQETPKQVLDLKLSDIVIINRGKYPSQRYDDIGFDTFVLSESCDLDTTEFDKQIEKRDSPGPFIVAMLIVIIPGYVFIEGIIAICHRLFGI